jgi:hypothetical protein
MVAPDDASAIAARVRALDQASELGRGWEGHSLDTGFCPADVLRIASTPELNISEDIPSIVHCARLLQIARRWPDDAANGERVHCCLCAGGLASELSGTHVVILRS